MATKKKEDKKQTEAYNIRQELADNADERNTYIRNALNDLPDADKVRNEKVLAKTREIIKDTFRGELNLKNATTIANAINLQHINEYMDSIEATRAPPPPPSQPSSSSASSSSGQARTGRDAIMDSTLKEMKWRLGPALKQARLHDRTIKMEDIQKWRKENYNMEKRPRKFNSWIPNKAKEEYQADLFFFDDLKQKDDEPAKYSAGLLVVDTFSKKIAVVPIKDKTVATLLPALEQAFRKLGNKPEMLYTDAESGLTANATQEWLNKKQIAHNITLRHAPVAERMIGHIKNLIFKTIQITNKKWWEVVDDVVNDYNKNHKSRSTLMTPNEATDPKNQKEVKTQLESIRKSDNPQPRIEAGDKVRVIIKKKFEKGYMPDWSDELYTVQSVFKGKDKAPIDRIALQPVIERQAMYRLRDPNNTLSRYKNGMYSRSELLLVKKG